MLALVCVRAGVGAGAVRIAKISRQFPLQARDSMLHAVCEVGGQCIGCTTFHMQIDASPATYVQFRMGCFQSVGTGLGCLHGLPGGSFA